MEIMMHSVKIIFVSFILYPTICRSALLPSQICHKIPTTGPNVQTPPILNTYRQRFDFILTTPTSMSSNSGRIANLGTLSTVCPWKWHTDNDPNRFPRMIPYAKCDNCNKTFCKPVKFYHKVLYSKCDYKTGEMVWEWKEVELKIGYVYVKPSSV